MSENCFDPIQGFYYKITAAQAISTLKIGNNSFMINDDTDLVGILSGLFLCRNDRTFNVAMQVAWRLCYERMSGYGFHP